MGSLNTDGSRITQSKKMIRNVGGAYTHSVERIESDTLIGPQESFIGPQADVYEVQKTTVSYGRTKKITSSIDDGLVARKAPEEDATPVN